VIQHAITPSKPFNINVFKIFIIGLLFGLIVGIILALLQETLDTSIGTIEDVEDYLKAFVLGVIPHTNFANLGEKIAAKFRLGKIDPEKVPGSKLIAFFDPKSPSAESFRILRTNLRLKNPENPLKTIVCCSSVMQEGKSTTISNLGITFAQAGLKTLILGCNLRRPSLYRVFDISIGPGMVDILNGKKDWKDCVRNFNDMGIRKLEKAAKIQTPGMANLNVITSGGVPPNPSELVSSSRMEQLLKTLKNEFDIILIDSTPVMPVTDSTILSSRADGTIIVYQVGRVPRSALFRTKERLESVKSHVLGIVLNNTKSEMSGYFQGYHRYYSEYYGTDDKSTKKKKKKNMLSWFGIKMWLALGGGLFSIIKSNSVLFLLLALLTAGTSISSLLYARFYSKKIEQEFKPLLKENSGIKISQEEEIERAQSRFDQTKKKMRGKLNQWAPKIKKWSDPMAEYMGKNFGLNPNKDGRPVKFMQGVEISNSSSGLLTLKGKGKEKEGFNKKRVTIPKEKTIAKLEKISEQQFQEKNVGASPYKNNEIPFIHEKPLVNFNPKLSRFKENKANNKNKLSNWAGKKFLQLGYLLMGKSSQSKKGTPGKLGSPLLGEPQKAEGNSKPLKKKKKFGPSFQTKYTLQIQDPMASPSKASQLASVLKKRGFPVFIQTIKGNDTRPKYRVCFGKYDRFEEAFLNLFSSKFPADRIGSVVFY